MGIVQYAFLIASLDYINQTDFGYCLEFHEDEAIYVALGHFLNRHR